MIALEYMISVSKTSHKYSISRKNTVMVARIIPQPYVRINNTAKGRNEYSM